MPDRFRGAHDAMDGNDGHTPFSFVLFVVVSELRQPYTLFDRQGSNPESKLK